MTTRYQKSQIEDVARLLVACRTSVDGPKEYMDGINEYIDGINDAVWQLVGLFADLFATDNPLRCTICGDVGTRFCEVPGQEHTFEDGFDREQFLAACGLEVE